MVFVDNGRSINILYYNTYKMWLLDKEMILKIVYLNVFGREAIRVKRTIRLPVTLWDEPTILIQIIDFMILDQDSAHNALTGWPLLKEMKVITLIYHVSMKLPTSIGVGCIKGCQYE